MSRDAVAQRSRLLIRFCRWLMDVDRSYRWLSYRKGLFSIEEPQTLLHHHWRKQSTAYRCGKLIESHVQNAVVCTLHNNPVLLPDPPSWSIVVNKRNALLHHHCFFFLPAAIFIFLCSQCSFPIFSVPPKNCSLLCESSNTQVAFKLLSRVFFFVVVNLTFSSTLP